MSIGSENAKDAARAQLEELARRLQDAGTAELSAACLVTLGDGLRLDVELPSTIRGWAQELLDEDVAQVILNELMPMVTRAVRNAHEERDDKSAIRERDAAESAQVALTYIAATHGTLDPLAFEGYPRWIAEVDRLEAALRQRLSRAECEHLLGDRAAIGGAQAWFNEVAWTPPVTPVHGGKAGGAVVVDVGARLAKPPLAAADLMEEELLHTQAELDLSYHRGDKRLSIDMKCDPTSPPVLHAGGAERAFVQADYAPTSYELVCDLNSVRDAVVRVALSGGVVEMSLRTRVES